MKPIELNLSSNPYRNDAPLTLGLSVLLVLAIVFTGSNAYSYLTADQTKDGLVAKLADHRATMDAMRAESEKIREDLAAIDAEVLGAQATFVSGILAQRNFSWTALLNALEEVLPWNVRLSIIRPEFGSMGRVTLALRGTARDVDAFYDLQDELEASNYFSEVVPGNWQYSSRDSMGDDTVEFLLNCRYAQVESGRDDDAELRQASLPLEDDPEGGTIVVDGERDPEEGREDPPLESPPGAKEDAAAPSPTPSPATRSTSPSPTREARGGASSGSSPPQTREERRAARRAREAAGGLLPGAAGAGAGTTAGRAGNPATAAPRAPVGAIAPGSSTPRTGRAPNQQTPSSEEATGLPGQVPPKTLPAEELVEVGEDGVKNLKLKPAPERPVPTTEEEAEAGQGSAAESGSGSSEQGSGGASGSGSGSGGSTSGGGS